MGFPSLSPVMADLALLQLEHEGISTFDYDIPLNVRYVDHILLCIQNDNMLHSTQIQ